MSSGAENVLDAASAGIALASLFDVLPHISALLSIIWLCTRLYDWMVLRGFIKGQKIKLEEEEDDTE